MRFALVALVLAATPAALAGTERCQQPFGPVVPNGSTASVEEMRSAKKDVLNFISDSDTYQECLLRVMDDPAEKMTEPQKTSALKSVSSNQKEKEEVAAAFNAALKVFKGRGLSLD